MRSSSLVAGLSIAAQVLAKQAPTLEVVARQLCGWQGHCYGDPCEGYSDCDGDMICIASQCRYASQGGPPFTDPTTQPIFTILPTVPTGRPTVTTTVTIIPDRTTVTIIPDRSTVTIIPDRPTVTIIPDRPSTTSLSSQPTPTTACVWPGHCLGDKCKTENDCDMDWICLAGQCAIPDEDPAPVIPEPTTTPSATCEFPGHCLGDPCVVHEDCDDILACYNGQCTTPEPEASGIPCADAGCVGASCATDEDCGGGLLVCNGGRCGL